MGVMCFVFVEMKGVRLMNMKVDVRVRDSDGVIGGS